jgi:hypothetical protein
MDILEEIGDFTRIGFELFFIETKVGSYVYDRLNNTISQYGGSYYSYLEQNGILKVKFKGKHKIRDYCGNGVRVL